MKYLFVLVFVLTFVQESCSKNAQILKTDLTDSVPCHLVYNSTAAYPSVCLSDKPLPIKITVTLKITKPTFWFGLDDWFYYLLDKDSNKQIIHKCTQASSDPQGKFPNDMIILSLSCNELPRELALGDQILFVTFLSGYHPIQQYLTFTVPIPNYSTLSYNNKQKSSLQLFREEERNQKNIQKLKSNHKEDQK